MRRALGLLLFASALAAPGAKYEGKYRNDPRLRRIRAELPGKQAAATRRLEGLLGVTMPKVELRLEDAGRDPSGAWAEAKGDVLLLKTEYLVLGAYDLEKTLVHELFHCLHATRLGPERYRKTPAWAREGAALFLAGQGAERARVLAALVGRDPLVDDPVGRLVDGLESRHTFLDYYEDVAAFEAVAERHGRKKAVALVKELLATGDVKGAIHDVLGEDFAAFQRAATRRARRVLTPLVSEGRSSILAIRAHLAAGEPARALRPFDPQGVYAPAAAYYRALALHRLGRHADALAELRERFLASHRSATTLLDRAVRLEVELLEAAGSPEHAAAAARARLDLAPYP